jgi:pyruvate/2-oxoglutarate dehydrogenase complex dihydrolipoamide dehydrogenase (E3) component
MQHILPRDDAELSAIVREQMKHEGVAFYEQAGVERVEHGTESVRVHINHDEQSNCVEGTHLLVAAGRKANIDDMGLESAGVQTHKHGIQVDKRLRTSNKRVYAAGDVAGGPQFTHVAAYHSSILIRNIVFHIPAKVNYASLPWVTYTDPELANVGLTPQQASDQYGADNIQVTQWRFKDNDRAVAERGTEGLAKVVTTRKGHILGATICGPGAGELIGLWGLAIDQKLKIGAVANMIAAYPTYSEVSKRLGGAFFTPKLFSDKTRKLVGWLQKIPGL